MPGQQNPLNFGDIPDAGAQAPTEPQGAGAPGRLDFGGIPDAGPSAPVLSDVARNAAMGQKPPADPLAPPAPSVVSRGPRGMGGVTVPTGARRAVTAITPVVAATRGFDPRTPEGRQNLAAGVAGGAAATMTGGLGVAPWLTALLATPAAAAAGGMTAEAGEQIAGTKPPSSAAVVKAGGTQAAYEVGGKLLLWPLKYVGKRIMATRVARNAREGVESGLRTARATAQDAMDAVRDKGRQFMAGERQAVTSSVRAAQKGAALDVEAATMKGQREVADAQQLYDELRGDPPSILDAGAKVRAVVNPRDTAALPKGPAQRALDAVGAKVSEAAETGPRLPIVADLKQKLDEMVARARPTAIFGSAAEEVQGMGFLAQFQKGRAQRSATAAGLPPGAPGASSHSDVNQIVTKLAKELGISENHPLPGILGKIATMSSGDLGFAEAHALKKLLDESVNWDRAASKHVEQITKGLRQTLREAMSVHEPYNAATRAFEQVIPLYRKSVGKQLIKDALSDPDKVVRVLSARDPARAQQVKDLLVGQAAAGGDAALGQQAWQAIQSAWVYNHVIRGGADGLSKRMATVLTENPEFSRIVLGDDTAKRILSNIDHIGQAYLQAEKLAGEQLLQAKAGGQAAVQTARDAGSRRLTRARDTVADATRTEGRAQRANVDAAATTRENFRNSSIAHYADPLSTEHTAADIARVAALGPRTFTGALSLIRILKGPKGADLVQWASYSDQNTQQLVRALNSQLPAAAVADLLREMTAHAQDLSSDRAGGAAKSATVSPAGAAGRVGQ